MSARLSAERLAEIRERRAMGWLPLDEWGPKCAGCGADEYRLDGFCSLRCRDEHCDDDIPELLEHIAALDESLAAMVEDDQRCRDAIQRQIRELAKTVLDGAA